MTALGKQSGAELAKLTRATYEREPEVIGGGYCVSPYDFSAMALAVAFIALLLATGGAL